MKSWMAVAAVVAGLGIAAVASEPTPVKSVTDPGFSKLAALAGQWKGKAADGMEVQAVYRVVADGSVVEEYLSHGDMVTMYHLDGDRLMLTHYCAAHNQPRMRAAPFKAGDQTLAFTFFDATNFPDPKAVHMHAVSFTFRDADHFTQEWTHYKDGAPTGKVALEYERVKP